MSRVLSKVKTRLQTLPLGYLYNPKDEGGRGRFTMLMSGIMSGLIGQLSGGLFYTSFLLQYGLDKSKIGILTFVTLAVVSLVTYRSSGSYKDEEGFK